MLNLSDKELDRLSREAAQEYDPGDLSGPRGWEKLEVHLDRDLGKVNPIPMRGIRRFPFFYAPALLLLLGVSYYFVRPNKAKKTEPSGSPPTVLQTPQTPVGSGKTNDASSLKNSEHSENSTSANDKEPVTVQYPAPPRQPIASSQPASSLPATSGPPASSLPAPSGQSSATSGHSDAGNLNNTTGRSTPSGSSQLSSSGSAHRHLPSRDGTAAGPTINPATGLVASNGLASNGRTSNSRTSNGRGYAGQNGRHNSSSANGTGRQIHHAGNGSENDGVVSSRNSVSTPVQEGVIPTEIAAAPSSPREPAWSSVRHARSLRQSPAVPDSGLRAFTARTGPGPLVKKKGVLRVNRSLQLGLSVAPDFSSVNSLAGDKPGSSIGLTVDYQFANRWWLGTGLLLSRKNYAARPEDYHVPYDYYQNNNLHNVDFVKGTFNMLEIPLNLRYDFSVTGNTVFFASGGLSSYLFTSENCNYYYNNFGREDARGFSYPHQSGYLFSAVNLSLGVEAGISNSFSLLVAPYMKIPTHAIGFGQVQMSSVGIDFALKFTPVLSRKRR